jgi:twitching motility two-component system response regulator PilG
MMGWPQSIPTAGKLHKIHLQRFIPVASVVQHAAPSSQPGKEVAHSTQSPGKYIVIIDDSPTVRKIVETRLRREGYEVDGYHDGMQAFQAFAQPGARLPDLIVLDIGLPNMDGYEVARRLKRHAMFQHTILLMLTRCDGVIDRLKGRLAGAKVYLTKPFRTQDLVAIIREQLGGAPDEGSQP